MASPNSVCVCNNGDLPTHLRGIELSIPLCQGDNWWVHR